MRGALSSFKQGAGYFVRAAGRGRPWSFARRGWWRRRNIRALVVATDRSVAMRIPTRLARVFARGARISPDMYSQDGSPDFARPRN